MAQTASPQAIADYRRKLAEYQAARAAFEAEAGAYWSSIAEKRRGRNAKRRERQQITLDDYVLTQPPVYAGPKRPVNPRRARAGKQRRAARKPIPVVADLLRAARDHYQWTPQRPATEIDFKRAYARYRGRCRADARAGGAGLCVRDRRQRQLRRAGRHRASRGGKRAISTAIGYNQLLTTNSVELIAEQGR